MSYQSTRKQLQAECDRWNKAHPVGTKVIVWRDTPGLVTQTKTRSAAQVLSGHSAVIWLEGIAGCYALSHVRALQ